MKLYFIKLIPGLSLFILAFGCNDSSTTNETTSTDTAKTEKVETITPPTTDTNTGVTNEFVNKAAMVGMMEVELGNLAQTNAGRQDVKDFGKMLADDHTAANNTLKGVAAAQNINVPSAVSIDMQEHIKDMQAMKGADFDKHYIDMMVEDHGKAIADFKAAADGNENNQVKDFAQKTLPALQKHLDRAKAIKAKM
jgi:putative membrane protein